MLDLAGNPQAGGAAASALSDPWVAPFTPAPPPAASDPWAPKQTNDPWSSPSRPAVSATSEPWSGGSAQSTPQSGPTPGKTYFKNLFLLRKIYSVCRLNGTVRVSTIWELQSDPSNRHFTNLYFTTTKW